MNTQYAVGANVCEHLTIAPTRCSSLSCSHGEQKCKECLSYAVVFELPFSGKKKQEYLPHLKESLRVDINTLNCLYIINLSIS